MGGRIYDPLAGRFMSPDPIMQAPYWSQGQNRYSYVFNDPINSTDPSGFATQQNTGSNAAAVGTDPAVLAWGGVAMGAAVSQAGALSAGLGALGGAGNIITTLAMNPFGGSAGGSYQVPSGSAAANSNGGGVNAPIAVAQNRPPGPAVQEGPSPSDRADAIAQRLEELPDQRLALVTATYDRSAGKLVVVDDDTGARVEIDVVSGGRPRGAPIPKGRYEILEQGKNGQFRLDAVDAKPRNDVHEPTSRTHFRLHHRGSGRTIGCVAAVDDPGWDKVSRLIRGTATTTVPDNYETPWYNPFGAGNITKFGQLIVK